MLVIYGFATPFCLLSVLLHIKLVRIYEDLYHEKYHYLNIIMRLYLQYFTTLWYIVKCEQQLDDFQVSPFSHALDRLKVN